MEEKRRMTVFLSRNGDWLLTYICPCQIGHLFEKMTLCSTCFKYGGRNNECLGLDRGAQVGNAHFWKRISAQALTLVYLFRYTSGPGIPPTSLDFFLECGGCVMDWSFDPRSEEYSMLEENSEASTLLAVVRCFVTAALAA